MMTQSLKVQILAAGVALMLVSALVARTSTAFFADTTASSGDWTAGTVTVTDDDGATAATTLTASGLKPGDSGYSCIEVTYGGTLAGADLAGVKLYASSIVDTDGGADTGAAATLSDDLDVTVATLSSADYGLTDCATFLGGSEIKASGALSTMGTDYAGGHGSWTPASSGEVLVYKVGWTLGSDTANDAQGDRVDATFTWEARSA